LIGVALGVSTETFQKSGLFVASKDSIAFDRAAETQYLGNGVGVG
jgi:hypothetical protein